MCFAGRLHSRAAGRQLQTSAPPAQLALSQRNPYQPTAAVRVPMRTPTQSHLIYELDERGANTLRERGFPCQRAVLRGFAHELMICEVMASFELSAPSVYPPDHLARYSPARDCPTRRRSPNLHIQSLAVTQAHRHAHRRGDRSASFASGTAVADISSPGIEAGAAPSR